MAIQSTILLGEILWMEESRGLHTCLVTKLAMVRVKLKKKKKIFNQEKMLITHQRLCICIHNVAVQSLNRVRLCDPKDCSPPDPSVHGIFQARIQEWVAVFFSRGSS